MTTKYKGSITELRERVLLAGIDGAWADDEIPKYSFRSDGGGILNWWSSTGTIQFQGQADAQGRLRAAIFSSSLNSNGAVASTPRVSRQIFIVHGHDTVARDQLELVLHRLDLEPFVLMNSSAGGKTLIEALEGKIGKDFSSDFGIVLMTPDDIGYSQLDGQGKAQPRARQNVILETGMLLSSLTRHRLAIVGTGNIEVPSDLQGIIRLTYKSHIREVVAALCDRLREAGFNIDAAKITAASR